MPSARRWRKRAPGNRAAPGPWNARKAKPRKPKFGLDEAFVDFSRCLFLIRGAAEAAKKTAEEGGRESVGGGPPIKSIQLKAEDIDFGGFVFPSDARFKSATFTGNALFGSATFVGDAQFEGANFTGDARFKSATFTSDARFKDTKFSRIASFGNTTFTGDAQFRTTKFNGFAFFESAAFTGAAHFNGATFTSFAWFTSATFTRNAQFEDTNFIYEARFESATFWGDAWFTDTVFTGAARFAGATFTSNAFFLGTQFKKSANFELAGFKQFASFASSRFESEASFNAIRGERSFDMADARFEAVPEFIQAHFEEAPRLDNLKVYGRWIKRHPRPERKEAKEQPEKGKYQDEPESKSRRRWHAVRHFGGRVRTWPIRAAKGAWRRVREGMPIFPRAGGHLSGWPSRGTTPSASCNITRASCNRSASRRIGRCRSCASGEPAAPARRANGRCRSGS